MKNQLTLFFLLINYVSFGQLSNQWLNIDQLEVDLLNTTNLYPKDWIIDETIVRSRLKELEKDLPLTYNAKVHEYIELFAYRYSDFTQLMLERKNMYFPIFDRILKEYNIPNELKYLTLIESGLDPQALSRVGAGGLWQFMPRTATIGFKMNLNYEIDERFDPEIATRAACLYLKELHDRYKDWYLVLASYNYGPGNVNRAIRRSGGERDYWKLAPYLPSQTENYVPKIIAMNYLMHYSDDYFIFPIKEHQYIPYDTIQFNHAFDLKLFSSLTNSSLDTLKMVNPHLKSDIFLPPTKNYFLKVPVAVLDSFRHELPTILDSIKIHTNKVYLSKIKHKIRPGENLSIIAQKYGMSVTELKRINNLTSNLIREGKYLYVKKRLPGGLEEQKIDYNNYPQNGVYIVRRGDTLSGIADKFKNLSINQLKQLNNLNSSRIYAGMKLKIK